MRKCSVEFCDNEARGNSELCGRHQQQIRRKGYIQSRTRFDSNEIKIIDGIPHIILYDTYGTPTNSTLIDMDDIEKCSKIKWAFSNGYVTNSRTKTYLHRFLLDVEGNTEIDHINRNKLDNRKSNLRICTRSENGCNKKAQTNNKLGIKGVCWNKARGLWHVQISKDKRKVYSALFDNLEDAIKAHNENIIKIHGEYSVTY